MPLLPSCPPHGLCSACPLGLGLEADITPFSSFHSPPSSPLSSSNHKFLYVYESFCLFFRFHM